MKHKQNTGTFRKARKQRTIELAPMARAVRSALAISTMALALGAVAPAVVAAPAVPAAWNLQLTALAPGAAPVFDLTTIAPPAAKQLGAGTPGMTAISIVDAGDVVIDNSNPETATPATGEAIAVLGYSTGGNVAISNHDGADLTATSTDYGAIGIYGYATVGNTSIVNAGDIQAQSTNGLADGIFASGALLDVSNSGAISAVGNTWASGIEARATGVDTIDNTGSIYAGASGATGKAYGIYASGDGVTVSNDGALVARGYYATGIFAKSYGDLALTNDGVINAGIIGSSALAWGINASSNGGAAALDIQNSAAIGAEASYGATGIQAAATGLGSTAVITNSGDITVTQNVANATYGADGIVLSADGNATIVNSGDIKSKSSGAAAGLTSMSFSGNANVSNSGHISATSNYSGANATTVGGSGIIAFSGTGTATVDNSGDIEATGFWVSKGVDVQAQGDVDVSNSGMIYAAATLLAFGVYAVSTMGDVTIENAAAGAIDVFSPASNGWGLLGIASQGDVNASNAGHITSYAYNQSSGIFASAAQGDVLTTNTGSIDVTAYGNHVGLGIFARATAGQSSTVNSGDIKVTSGNATYLGLAANGIRSLGDQVDVLNSGTVAAYSGASAAGILLQATTAGMVSNSGSVRGISTGATGYGITATSNIIGSTMSVTNSGTIVGEQHLADTAGAAYGVLSSADASSSIINSGSITAASLAAAYGARASSITGQASVVNSGVITATSSFNDSSLTSVVATAIDVQSSSGAASVTNTGSVTATSATGVTTVNTQTAGDISISNSGSVVAQSELSYATGLRGVSTNGKVVVQNASAGVIDVQSTDWRAFGIIALSDNGDVLVENSGTITGSGAAFANGISARSTNGNISISNSGDIDVTNTLGNGAIGIQARNVSGTGVVKISNSGDISVSGSDQQSGYGGFGVYALGGNIEIENSGTIHFDDHGINRAIAFINATGTSTLVNVKGGHIAIQGGALDAFSVFGDEGVETIRNAGEIEGAVTLFGGNDTFENQAGGVWSLDRSWSTNFGDGDDAIHNLAGGLIRLNDASIDMGAGTNTIVNDGVIASNLGVTLDMGGAGTLTNNGLLDLRGGAAGDTLVIDGVLAGTGAISVDAYVDRRVADHVQVNGNVSADAVQTVDVALADVPTMTQTLLDVIDVTGQWSASNFVAGKVSGAATTSFLDVGLTLPGQPATAAAVGIGAQSVAPGTAVTVSVNVDGLSDAGTLGASLVSGAAGLMNAQVGNFRQRLGANPYAVDGRGLQAFVRYFNTSGELAPEHVADNFGSAGHFNYKQSNSGFDVGLSARIAGNLHIGAVLSQADARQRLTDDGVGTNRLKGKAGVGLFATWYMPDGFYLDLSSRRQNVDITSTSSVGNLNGSVHASALSVEGGYAWKLGGYNLVPQAQLTRTRVGNTLLTSGNSSIRSTGGTYSQARLGAELNKTIQTGAWQLTPYASLSFLRESDGKSHYVAAGNFSGSTSMSGQSSLLDLGLGAQHRRLGFNVGIGMINGGAYKRLITTQANLHYVW